MKDTYVHGYAADEQERLLQQADHWREELILAGTTLVPGTRLLEIGCGVGAVLGILGLAFPDIAVPFRDPCLRPRKALLAGGAGRKQCEHDSQILGSQNGSRPIA